MLKIYKTIADLKSKYKSNIVFDTRLIKKNDIFIGLKTENNDGSLYYKDAIKKSSIGNCKCLQHSPKTIICKRYSSIYKKVLQILISFL